MDIDDRVTVGLVTSCHGVKGELRVKVFTDFPERFSAGEKLFIGKENEPVLKSVTVKSSRWNKDILLVSLEGIETRNQAELLRGYFFWIDRKELKKLPKDRFYIFELEGLEAYDLKNNRIGTLSEVIHTPAYDVYVIKGEGKKELLVPAFKKFVTKIDIDRHTIFVDTESLEFED